MRPKGRDWLQHAEPFCHPALELVGKLYDWTDERLRVSDNSLTYSTTKFNTDPDDDNDQDDVVKSLSFCFSCGLEAQRTHRALRHRQKLRPTVRSRPRKRRRHSCELSG